MILPTYALPIYLSTLHLIAFRQQRGLKYSEILDVTEGLGNNRWHTPIHDGDCDPFWALNGQHEIMRFNDRTFW